MLYVKGPGLNIIPIVLGPNGRVGGPYELATCGDDVKVYTLDEEAC